MNLNSATKPNSWDNFEANCLARLQRAGAELRSQIHAFYRTAWDTREDFDSILAVLCRYETELLQMRPDAVKLWNQGHQIFNTQLNTMIEYVWKQQHELRGHRAIKPARNTGGQVSPPARLPDPGHAFDLRAQQSLSTQCCYHCDRYLGPEYLFVGKCKFCGRIPRPIS